MKRFAVLILILVFCIALPTACNSAEQYFIFGTVVQLEFSGARLEKRVVQRLNELDAELSTSLESSDIYRINHAEANQSITVGEDTLYLIKLAKQLYVDTNGAFNPAIYPLVELWRFTPDTYTGDFGMFELPDAQTIADTMALCNPDFFIVDEANKSVVKTIAEAKLDLGALAKGYAAEQVANMAKAQSGFVDVGGNIYALSKPIKAGIRDPRGASYCGTVTVSSSITTSGDYERYYIGDDGTRYCHIIDGRTGYPADSGLISVTVLGADGASCDALSTAVFVLGAERGAELLKAQKVSAVLIDNDNRVYTVSGGDFSLSTGNYTYAGEL